MRQNKKKVQGAHNLDDSTINVRYHRSEML